MESSPKAFDPGRLKRPNRRLGWVGRVIVFRLLSGVVIHLVQELVLLENAHVRVQGRFLLSCHCRIVTPVKFQKYV